MTSELRLRIDKYLEGDITPPPQIFAKIYPVKVSNQRWRIAGAAREELVPISNDERYTTLVQLNPGRYTVEVVLPSGEMLSDNISLRSNEKKNLVLSAEDSPHEWLSWQHLMGNVSTTPAIKPRTKRRVSTKKGGYLRRRSPHKDVTVQLPLQFLDTPVPAVAAESNPEQMWSWLTQLRGSTPAALIHQLNGNGSPVRVNPSDSDNRYSVFRVSLGDTPTAEATRATPLGHFNLLRRFMVLSRRNSIELLSLPMPWGVNDSPIEIVIQAPNEESQFCSSMSVMDNAFGMLLGYLSSGSIPTARQFAETAQKMLFEKMENKFAAAAGAYALVGTALHASEQNWHKWVMNLMNWFETMPDGAIQWGQLKLRMRRNSRDIEEARNAFKLAFNRGLPFYSLGMRWLVDGLEAVSYNDPEAAEMLTYVRRVSWLANYKQPFTMLKLETHRNV
jgi:hypothetical protein